VLVQGQTLVPELGLGLRKEKTDPPGHGDGRESWGRKKEGNPARNRFNSTDDDEKQDWVGVNESGPLHERERESERRRKLKTIFWFGARPVREAQFEMTFKSLPGALQRSGQQFEMKQPCNFAMMWLRPAH
jgi:hypothetical protein